MKKLLKKLVDEKINEVSVFMKDGLIYDNLKVQELGNSAFRVVDHNGVIRLILYDEVKQIKTKK